jgi:probable rRNA maturation factor
LSIKIDLLEIERNWIFNQKLYRKLEEIVRIEKRALGEVHIILTSNEYVLKINRKFLNHHYYTDVITFSNNKKNLLSGDIYISVDQVFINAEQLNVGFMEELKRVIIHGILHLVGYNDQSEDEKMFMRVLEDQYLCTLKGIQILNKRGV